MKRTLINPHFAFGFFLASILWAGHTLLSRIADWFGQHPQPQAILNLLNKPLFSILEIFSTGVLLLFVAVILFSSPNWAFRS